MSLCTWGSVVPEVVPSNPTQGPQGLLPLPSAVRPLSRSPLPDMLEKYSSATRRVDLPSCGFPASLQGASCEGGTGTLGVKHRACHGGTAGKASRCEGWYRENRRGIKFHHICIQMLLSTDADL